mmetsp:Transcript_32073/g.81003  ORF Transcript_32073/g.81003 Transcript_32073/m.81003 type:complete len:161 (-) Transcript_32073:86-568(-)
MNRQMVTAPTVAASTDDGCCIKLFGPITRNWIAQIVLSFGICLTTLIFSILVGINLLIFTLGGEKVSDLMQTLLSQYEDIIMLVVKNLTSSWCVMLIEGAILILTINSLCFWIYKIMPIPHLSEDGEIFQHQLLEQGEALDSSQQQESSNTLLENARAGK